MRVRVRVRVKAGVEVRARVLARVRPHRPSTNIVFVRAGLRLSTRVRPHPPIAKGHGEGRALDEG